MMKKCFWRVLSGWMLVWGFSPLLAQTPPPAAAQALPAAAPTMPPIAAPVPVMPALAIPTAPPSEPGFGAVEVDLGARKFNGDLPFDIPFYLYGKVPGSTKLVGIQIAEFDKKQPPEELQPEWQPVPPLLWKHLPELDQLDEKGRLTFRVLLQPLQPGHFYQFRFWLTPTNQQVDTFQRAARELLERRLQNITLSTLQPEEQQALQAELLASLKLAAGSEEFLAPDTLFDPNDGGASMEKLKKSAQTVLEPQVYLREAWNAYLVRQGELQRQLVGIRDFGALTKLTDLSKKSTELLNQYLQLKARYEQMPAAPTASPAPDQGGGATPAPQATPAPTSPITQDANLAEFLGTLNEQVQRFYRITESIKKFPELMDNVRKSFAAIQANELVFLSGSAEVSSIAGVEALFAHRDPAEIDKLLANYATAEEALAQLQTFLISPDTETLMQDLMASQEFTAALSAKEKESLGELTQAGGLIALARDNLVTMERAIRDTQERRKERNQALAVLNEEIPEMVRGKVLVLASTTGLTATRSSNYFSLDAGVAYAWDLDSALPYLGVNLYFRPINRQVPLRQLGGILRRLALTVGVTLKGVADKDEAGKIKTRDNLFAGRILLFGVGVRMTNSIRLGFGSALLLKKDSNPLVDRSSLALTPYVNLSLDVNVQGAAKKIGDTVGKFFK